MCLAAALARPSSVPAMERFGPLTGLIGDREGDAGNLTGSNALTRAGSDELPGRMTP